VLHPLLTDVELTPHHMARKEYISTCLCCRSGTSARPALRATVIGCDEGLQQLYMGYRQSDRPQAAAQPEAGGCCALVSPQATPKG
jgi:hypothetical protein